jgi:hypothetical protein
LADATAGIPGFFTRDGGLYRLSEGVLVLMTGETLAQTIEKFVVTQKSVNKGTAEEPNWVFEFTPYCSPRTP